MKFRWLMVIALAGGVGAILLLQRQTASGLAVELQSLRNGSQQLSRLRTENQRLIAAQITADEIQKLQSQHATVAGLRREIERLQQAVGGKEKEGAVAARRETALKPEDVPSVTETMVPMSFLKNAGSLTPAAATETALWAAVGGDLETLAKSLVIDPPERTKIETLIAQLPEGERMKYGTPERFVAFMAAQDIPASGRAQILEVKPEDPFVAMQIRDPNGVQRMVAIPIRQEGSEWRFVVPANAVEKYAARLKGSPPPSEVK